MPIYTYSWCDGDTDATQEREVAENDKDTQFCRRCGSKLDRVEFNGTYWETVE